MSHTMLDVAFSQESAVQPVSDTTPRSSYGSAFDAAGIDGDWETLCSSKLSEDDLSLNTKSLKGFVPASEKNCSTLQGSDNGTLNVTAQSCSQYPELYIWSSSMLHAELERLQLRAFEELGSAA